MKRIHIFIIGLFLAAFSVFWGGCATEKERLKVENSLPQDELAYYSDPFDNMREDLWDRAGLLYSKKQIQNFKQADMRFENGKLIIRTRTGSFSKGGLGSKYALRGDFDLQLDCQVDFLKGTSGMDQLLNFSVFEKSGMIGKGDVVVINLTMGELMHQGWFSSGARINGIWNKGSSKLTKSFDGTLRFLRKGRYIRALYKKKEASKWSEMHTFHATDNDMICGFQVRNFFNKRTTILATQSIHAEFDNFKINAVQEIIEEEI